MLLASCRAAPSAGVRLVAPVPGDVAPQVLARVEEARKQRRQVLVYVGASWCEPCHHFHEAVVQGRMDGVLPPLDLVEFDLDVDAARLAAAGYQSRMIPLLAVPGADGRGSGRQMAGSIKGPGAPADMAGRLKVLLGPTP